MLYVVKILISAVVIVLVSEISGRSPRLGGLLLSLPIVSILAFVLTWQMQRDMAVITGLARETLILVPLGLPFFVPFALASRTGLTFWPSFFSGILMVVATIGGYFAISTRVGN
ncbi:MAG: DUF3147 family protein [Pirellulaceae bacterium]|nr:DUF3147 family protein [Pirellulaceae bacterium]